MDTHEPVIVTDGGPWAEHDMACAVCYESPAVIDIGTGIFQPCWDCQVRGYRLAWKRRWWIPLHKNRPPRKDRGVTDAE